MIGYIDGIVRAKRDSALVIGGIGSAAYVIQVTAGVRAGLCVEDHVELFVETKVSETDIVLYGFLTDEERVMFNALCKVNKVGGKTALAALDTLGYDGLASAVMSDDIKAISSVSGVGAATASRIAIDMKKFVKGLGVADMSDQVKTVLVLTMSSLEMMGYKRTEVGDLVNNIIKSANCGNLTVSDTVAAVLRAKARPAPQNEMS